MCRRSVAVAFGLGLLLAGPAFAASQQDWDGCQSKDPDRAIPACSSIIPDETETPQSRADAYAYRAGAYLAKGNTDRAISDYSEALKLTPRNIVAYVSRALAYFANGDRTSAILDYSIANKLDSAAVARIATGNSKVGEIAAAAAASPPPPSALAGVEDLPRIGTNVLAAPPPPPPPPPPPQEKPWNSVAASIWKVHGRVHVAIGYSGTRSTEEEARRSATDACQDAGGKTCKPTGAWNYGCVYITTGSAVSRAGWGSGATIKEALAKCREQGLTCKQPIGGCVD